MSAKYKDIPLEKFNGISDTRLPSGSLVEPAFRLVLNTDNGELNTSCRLPGWTRYGDANTCFQNRDLHDQMIGAQGYGLPYGEYGYCYDGYSIGRTCREAVTFLRSIANDRGGRRILAGTRSRLYVNDDTEGNWRILADGLGGGCNSSDDCGCSPVRMKAASLGNVTLITNDSDPVLFWTYDTGPTGCYNWSADYVPELAQLGITAARVITEYKGFILIANVVIEGRRRRNQIYWADFNDPLSWIPSSESLAGFTELGNDEEILAMEPIGGKCRIYTTKGIIDMVLVSDDRVFDFSDRVYSGRFVPKYDTILNTGDTHWFLGEADLFRMATYDRTPTAFEWMHSTSGAIFQGIKSQWLNGFSGFSAFQKINPSSCSKVSMGWRHKDRSIWISWPSGDETCPDMTMIIWPDYYKSTLVDHGFTAFCEHTPATLQSWRSFLGTTGLCNPDDNLLAKEGEPCPATFVPGDYEYLRNETEDPDLPMGDKAWFSNLCNSCLDDLCRSCPGDTVLVMASAADKCLKQFNDEVYYRDALQSQSLATFPATSDGLYTQDGYTTLIQGDSSKRGTELQKTVRKVAAGYTAEDQIDPSYLHFEIGSGESPDCSRWEAGEPQPLVCGDGDGSRAPQSQLHFGFYSTGTWIGWRLWVEGTGGQFCVSSLTFKFILKKGCW